MQRLLPFVFTVPGWVHSARQHEILKLDLVLPGADFFAGPDFCQTTKWGWLE